MSKYIFTLFIVLGITSLPVQAGIDGAKQFADQYIAHVKRIAPSYQLTADAGRDFYVKKYTRKGKEESCASCHMDSPASDGKHSETGKPIRPLSPVVNPKRFSNLQHVEENFTKHCHDIIGRDCTPAEKGDYITYLLTVKNSEAPKAEAKK
jgi:hypothetical protein